MSRFHRIHRLPKKIGLSRFARKMGLTPYLSFAQRNLTPPLRGLTHFSGKEGLSPCNAPERLRFFDRVHSIALIIPW